MTAGRIAAWGFVVFICLESAVVAADETQPKEKPPLRLARIKIPAAQVEKLVSGMRPFPAKQFEQKLQSLRAAWSEAGAAARITSAGYFARLSGNQLIEGRARFTIVRLADSTAVLKLDANSLPLGEGAWDEDPPVAATAGISASGEFVVLVDRDADLTFPWTLRGAELPGGELLFEFVGPRCAVNQLTLQLPGDVVPVAENAIVSLEGDQGGTLTNEETAGRFDMENGGSQLWSIRFGGVDQLKLRLTRSGKSAPSAPAYDLQTSTHYRLSPQGLNATADFVIDVRSAPLREMSFEVDESLSITDVRLGEESLNWRRESTDMEGRRMLVAQFAEPVLQSGVVRISAIAPLVTSSDWRLPRIWPRGGFWQQGGSTIEVLRPLSLLSLKTSDGRQQDVQAPSEPNAGTQVRIQDYSRDAAVELVVQPLEAELEVAAGATIQLGPTNITAQLRAEVQASRQTCFQIRAFVNPGWVVDAVETIPADVSEPWDRVDNVLTIPLRKPIPIDGGIQVVIDAHRDLSGDATPFQGSNLRVARFLGAASSRFIVAAHPEPPYRLQVVGDSDLSRLDPQQLSGADSRLVDAVSDSLVYIDGPEASDLQLGLDDEPPSFSAEVEVDVAVDSKSITEEYRILCKPLNSAISSLRVRFSDDRSAPLQWAVDGETESLQSIQRSVDADGETWDVALARPRRIPFEIRAVRTTPFAGDAPISLASLPAASTQSGTLIVRAARGAAFVLKKGELKPLPVAQRSSGEYTDIRAKLRYEPLNKAPVLIGQGGPTPIQQAAWVWNCQLTTRVTKQAALRHTATLYIENSGRQQIEVVAPPIAVIDRITVNDTEVAAPTTQSPMQRVTIPLPADLRFPVVRVTYSTRQRTISLFGVRRVVAPVLDVDAPILALNWGIMLPPGVRPASENLQEMPVASFTGFSARRFLGPLLQSDSEPFSPRWIIEQSGAVRGAVAERFYEVLSEVSAGDAPGIDVESLTWERLLALSQQRWVQTEVAPLPPLYIDRAALEAHGFAPSTLVEGDARGPALFEQTGLVLLAQAEALILTTSDSLLADTVGRTSAPLSSVATVRSGAADRLIRQQLEAGGTLSPFEAWQSQSESAPAWARAAAPSSANVFDAGWTSHWVAVDPAAQESGELVTTIYRPLAMYALGWATVLLAAGCMWRFCGGSVWRGVLLLALIAGVAQFAPAFAGPIVSGAFLGAAAVFLIDVFDPHRSLSKAGVRLDRAPLAGPASAVVPLLAAFLVSASGIAHGAEGDGQSEPAADSFIHRVLIPVDEDKQPSGDQVYIEDRFLRELDRRIAESTLELRSSIVKSAQYHTTLGWQGDDVRRLVVEEFYAEFLIETRIPSARVTLSFGQKGESDFVTYAEADGAPLLVETAAEENGAEFEIAQPGQHKVRLNLNVPLAASEGEAGFAFSIPRLPNSRLSIQTPVNAPRLQLRSVHGAVVRDEAAGRITAHIGPSGGLAVFWPAEESKASFTPLNATQLLWLKLRPQSVVVDAKFSIQHPAGETRIVAIQTDSRLRLENVNSNAAVRQQREVEDGVRRSIILEFEEPLKENLVVEASFRLPNASAVGGTRLPHISLATDGEIRRRFALSVSPELAYSTDLDDDVAEIGVDEFLAMWGDAESPPQLAFEANTESPEFSVVTRPLPSSTSVDEQTDISIRRRGVDVHFTADLNVSSGSRFQHQLRAPEELVLDRVVVEVDETLQPLRILRDPQGVITARLPTGLSGRHRLHVHGAIPGTGERELAVPRIYVEDAVPNSSRIRVYRLGSMEVSLQNHSGLEEETDDVAGAHQEGQGRLIHSWLVERDALSARSFSAQLTLRPLPLQAAGELQTLLVRSQEGWRAEVVCQIDVSQGRLDSVRLDVPAEWSGDLKLDPAIEHRVDVALGQSRRRLIIRPLRPISDQFVVKLRGPLEFRADGVEAPHVSLLDIDTVSHLVALPLKDGEQTIKWDLSGLQAIALSDQHQRLPKLPEPTATYQVVGDRFRARIEGMARAMGRLRVSLADIHVAAVDDSLRGIAVFDIEPAGRQSCTLRLPPECEIVHVRLGGAPAVIRSAGQRRCRLDLIHDQLPQRIEVLFRGKASEIEGLPGGLRLNAPEIENAPVEQTLWTVYDSRGDVQWAPLQQAGAADPVLQQFLRRRATARVVKRGANLIADSPTPDVVRAWCEPWTSRLRAARVRMTDLRMVRQLPSTIGPAELRAVDDAEAAIINQLDAIRLRSPFPRDSTLFDFIDQWSAGVGLGSSAAHFAFDAAAPTLEVSRIRTHRWISWDGVAVAAILSLIAAVWVLKPIRVAILDWGWRWPGTATILLGVTWWLYLAPSWLGLVFAAAGILLSMRRPWGPRRTAGVAASVNP